MSRFAVPSPVVACLAVVLYDGYQAFMANPEGGWVVASESRKDGHAAGY